MYTIHYSHEVILFYANNIANIENKGRGYVFLFSYEIYGTTSLKVTFTCLIPYIA